MEIIKSQKGKEQTWGVSMSSWQAKLKWVIFMEVCKVRTCRQIWEENRLHNREKYWTHACSWQHQERKCKIEASIRDRAENGAEKPRQIIVNSVTGVSLEAAHLAPSYSASKRIVEQKRKRSDVDNPRHHSVQDIILSDGLKVTTRSEQFQFWDSGNLDASRIFIFGIATNLQLLEQYSHWFMDGTFNVALAVFPKVFTIHVLIDNRSVPLI
jgi:hypothetical protein